MAQALFDDHPLGEYLREVGETSFSIPGISSELEREIDPNYGELDNDTPDAQFQGGVLSDFLEFIQSVVASAQKRPSSSPFVEKFKYNVISSSLLAPTLPTPHATRPTRIPGNIDHSRSSSIDIDPPTPPVHNYGPVSFGGALTAAFFSFGYPLLCLLSLLATLFMYHTISTTDTPSRDMTPSFDALDDLTAANDVWETVLHDTVALLENEESSSSGLSSPSPLRVALHSCLQTTHTQCDNIRHLFSALTCPAELSQLSEMYAPPSPMKSAFTMELNARPLSYPLSNLRSPLSPKTPENKRSTWNGSYTSLASAGSPKSSMHKRRNKHRMNLSDVFAPGITSAPVTPLPRTPNPVLSGVPEDEVPDEPMSNTSSLFSPQYNHFGAAALDLHRTRKTGGMDALSSPPPNYFVSDLQRRSRSNSASKFTTPQAHKHPLSYSALTYSLQGALAAKRYACSHLLALRFSDEDDEGYWEDVRSVMGLLTSSLADASSRLSEALDDAEQQKLRDQNPTPYKGDFSDVDIEPIQAASRRGLVDTSKISFAPVPNHISRFAAHVAAISSALDDAREHLEQCVEDLKSDPVPEGSTKGLKHSRSLSRMLSPKIDGEAAPEEPRALQAYERLRRELGLALRECERGRERLLEIVRPPAVASEDEEVFDDLPGLAHDGSDESDKQDHMSPSSEDENDLAVAMGSAAVVNTVGSEDGPLMDDATSHLLLTSTTQHLPLPGIEEVFEADTESKVLFTRERSRLTREERIKIAKAKRDSGMGAVVGVGVALEDDDTGHGGNMGQEKWGPGGEVVQELKDVIWKVGERRRKLTESIPQPRTMVEVENRDLGTSPAEWLESS